MLRRVGQRLFKVSNDRYFGTTTVCGKARLDEDGTSLYSTGGLEKFQGCLKEEKYFCIKNGVLMNKIRQQGETLACEKHLGNWSEFYKTITTDDKTAQRESSYLNKHKNCQEEAFFLNEQIDNVRLLQSKNMEIFSYTGAH